LGTKINAARLQDKRIIPNPIFHKKHPPSMHLSVRLEGLLKMMVCKGRKKDHLTKRILQSDEVVLKQQDVQK
jgi:hypothetical protein